MSTLINQISADKISTFRNQTKGKINIEINEIIEEITVLDISGKIILKTTETEIELTNYEIGTYILKVKTKNKRE